MEFMMKKKVMMAAFAYFIVSNENIYAADIPVEMPVTQQPRTMILNLDDTTHDVNLESVIKLAERIVKKETKKRGLSDELFNEIRDGLGYIRMSMQQDNLDITLDTPVLKKLLANCLLAQHENADKLLGTLGLDEDEKKAFTTVLSSTAAMIEKDEPLSIESFATCCFSTTLTIAEQLLDKNLDNEQISQ